MLFLSASDATTWVLVGVMVVVVIALLVIPMFTQKRQAKRTNEMHNAIRPGDRIKTVGGIIGTVVEVRSVSPVDKEMVIETGEGDNKTTMVFDMQALYQVLSKVEPSVVVSAPAQSQDTVFDDVKDNAIVSDNTADATVNAEPDVAETADIAEPEAVTVAEATEEKAPVKEQAAVDSESADVAVKPAAAAKPRTASKAPKSNNNGKKTTKK